MTNTQEQVLVLMAQMREQVCKMNALERIVWEQSSLIQALLERANCTVKKVLDSAKNDDYRSKRGADADPVPRRRLQRNGQ